MANSTWSGTADSEAQCTTPLLLRSTTPPEAEGASQKYTHAVCLFVSRASERSAVCPCSSNTQPWLWLLLCLCLCLCLCLWLWCVGVSRALPVDVALGVIGVLGMFLRGFVMWPGCPWCGSCVCCAWRDLMCLVCLVLLACTVPGVPGEFDWPGA